MAPAPVVPLTMDRLDGQNELIVAQSTSQCCRCLCFQPSINWVVAEGDRFEPGTNPHNLQHVGWFHEESSFLGRMFACCLPGYRAVKYVQHSGSPPASIIESENKTWFDCQCGKTTKALIEKDIENNVVATHEKGTTCAHCFNCLGKILFPLCNCCGLPYLETKDAEGKLLGKTAYVCDVCCFVPKYDIFNADNERVYRLRPDTCVAGFCVQCRCCEKDNGHCCRVPYILRDPNTYEPVAGSAAGSAVESSAADYARVDTVFSGVKNEVFTEKNAYHVVFPKDITAEEKLVLMGSTILVDITMNEQDT